MRSGVAEKRPDDARLGQPVEFRPQLPLFEAAPAHHPFAGRVEHPEVFEQRPHAEVFPWLAGDGEVQPLQDAVVGSRSEWHSGFVRDVTRIPSGADSEQERDRRRCQRGVTGWGDGWSVRGRIRIRGGTNSAAGNPAGVAMRGILVAASTLVMAGPCMAQGGTAYEIEAQVGVEAAQRRVLHALVRAGYPVDRADLGLIVISNLIDPKSAGVQTWVRIAIDGDGARARVVLSGQWTSATTASLNRAVGRGDFLQWQPIDDTKRGEAQRAVEQLTTTVAVVRAALQPKP